MFRTLGERTPVKPQRKSRSSNQPKTVNLGIDVPLLLLVITLLIFGLIMVYSASYDYSLSWYGDSSRIFVRQLLWLGLGLGVATFLVFFDYHHFRQLAIFMMGGTLIMLLGVLIVNEIRNGAVRTLAGGSVQPSELAKLVIVLYMSVWLYSKREQLNNIYFGFVPLAIILGGLGALIYLQPDLSAVLTIFILGGTMFFLAGVDLKQIMVLLVVAVVFGWIVVQLNSTGSERVSVYWAGLKDPLQASYHVRRALEALVKGGWFGVGIGRADTKLTGLPVPPTDSIFAVVGEETGFFGAAGLVGLYVLLLWRGLKIASQAPDGLGSLMAAGLTLWVTAEAFINMAVMVNLLPFAGNALPFISAGGSNLVVSLAAMGILLNISRLSAKQTEENGRSFSAVIDLRWRDRGRRVSRPRRTASTDRR